MISALESGSGVRVRALADQFQTALCTVVLRGSFETLVETPCFLAYKV